MPDQPPGRNLLTASAAVLNLPVNWNGVAVSPATTVANVRTVGSVAGGCARSITVTAGSITTDCSVGSTQVSTLSLAFPYSPRSSVPLMFVRPEALASTRPTGLSGSDEPALFTTVA